MRLQFERAVALDPRFATALAALTLTNLWEVALGSSDTPDQFASASRPWVCASARTRRSNERCASSGERPLLLGVDYYPDQTPEHLWEEDARLIAEAGLTNVRVAEFAWSLMEPAEGKFVFAWLERAVKILHEHGIAVILGTPSAAPPPTPESTRMLPRMGPTQGDQPTPKAVPRRNALPASPASPGALSAFCGSRGSTMRISRPGNS